MAGWKGSRARTHGEGDKCKGPPGPHTRILPESLRPVVGSTISMPLRLTLVEAVAGDADTGAAGDVAVATRSPWLFI